MLAVAWIGDEMKHGSVMPDVELAQCVAIRDVVNDPLDLRSPIAKSKLGRIDGGSRYIEHGNVLESCVDRRGTTGHRPRQARGLEILQQLGGSNRVIVLGKARTSSLRSSSLFGTHFPNAAFGPWRLSSCVAN